MTRDTRDTRDGVDEDVLAALERRDDDIEAVVAFYQRTGAMPVNTIGPPVDRPIIPPRRPDRVGDFVFSPDLDDRPAPAPPTSQRSNTEARTTQRELLAALRDLELP